MANLEEKKGVGGTKRKKKWTKYLMIFVGLVMLLSGLEMGLNREVPTNEAQDPSKLWNVVNYAQAQVSSESAVTRIASETNQFKLKPLAPSRIDQQDITDLFESNLTGVLNIVFENSPGNEMFHIETTGGNVSAEIKKRIRMTGGYTLFRVYKGATPYGEINVVGENLQAGDYVRVFLMERAREGLVDTLGFVQRKIDAGPVVNATVTGLEGYAVTGAHGGNLTLDAVRAVLNASDVSIGNATVTLSLPADQDLARAEETLGALGVANITASKLGYLKGPQEMIVDGQDVIIPNGNSMQASLAPETKVNDTIRARIIMLSIGNQTMGIATQEIGNKTG